MVFSNAGNDCGNNNVDNYYSTSIDHGMESDIDNASNDDIGSDDDDDDDNNNNKTGKNKNKNRCAHVLRCFLLILPLSSFRSSRVGLGHTL